MLFSFFRKKRNQTNVVELDSIVLHKSESLYYYDNYKRSKEDKCYYINTMVKNVPLEVGNDGAIAAKVRYIGIPDAVVYFNIRITNIKGEYVSGDKTIDVHVSATIVGDKCKDYKFELMPFIYHGGALACM